MSFQKLSQVEIIHGRAAWTCLALLAVHQIFKHLIN